MPKYYVFNVETGDIVHQHESYDATSGTSLPCSRDEVLELVEETLDKDKLDIVETEVERSRGSEPGAEILRVNLQTRALETQASE
jgi:hypothetical protein